MKYSWVLCVVLVFGGPVFAETNQDDSAHHGASAPGEDGDENEEPGIDSGEAPRDTLTQQRNEAEKHLRRLAKIQRIATIGAEQSNEKLVASAKMLREKELARHKNAVKRLETKALEESQ